jgi:hypothetical protein
MGKPCSICSHPNVQEIDSLLDSGTFQKTISEQFNISKFALSRHGRELCRADSLDLEESTWAARLEKTYQQAVVDQDVRGQQQVATTALRHVRARKAEKAKATAAKQDESQDNRISIGDLDGLVALLTEIPPDPVDQAKLRIALDKARALNRPDMVAIFYQAHENPRFAAALSDFAATWSEEKGTDELISQETAAPN